MTTLSATAGTGISILRYTAAVGLVFQGVHFIEHLAQLGYWIARPAEAPWLTPWAASGRDALAVGGNGALGNEILHLLGNLLFLGGLFALVTLSARWGKPLADFKNLRLATGIQSVHVLEHISLTATTLFFGKAIGLSTFFGLVSGPTMWSFRVWFHFLMNLAGTWYAAKAVLDLRREGFRLEGTQGRVARTSNPI